MIRSKAKESAGWQPQGRKALGMVYGVEGVPPSNRGQDARDTTIPKLRLRLPPDLTTPGFSLRADH